MAELRETLVALPPWHGDIYRRHQLVWRAMNGITRVGTSFVFAAVSEHMVAVRSDRIERGAISTLAEGQLRTQLVAARREGTRMTSIQADEMHDWAAVLLSAHGMSLRRLEVLSSSIAAGRKRDRTTGEEMAIRLPIKEVLLDVEIQHPAKANLAWAHGIGRGKRFGFGMLQRAN